MTERIIDLTSRAAPQDPQEQRRVFLRPPGCDVDEIVRPGDHYLSIDTRQLDDVALRRLSTSVLRRYAPTVVRIDSTDERGAGAIISDELSIGLLTVRHGSGPDVPPVSDQILEKALGHRPRTLILNRRSLQSLFDGDTCRIPTDIVDPYLVTHAYGGTTGLPPQTFANSYVVDVRDMPGIQAVAEWLVREQGVTNVSALQEKSVTLAARLRRAGGLFGTYPEVANGFRDKVTMKTRAAAAGIRVPQFQPIDSADDFNRIENGATRWVLKPRAAEGAAGVRVFDTLTQCRQAWLSGSRRQGEFEVEEYVEGQIYHCDAVFASGQLRFVQTSRYVGVPGEYKTGGFLASHLLPVSRLTRRMRRFAADVVRALKLTDGVAHLELFHTPDDELVLLEVASRPAGGLVTQAIKRSTGVDLLTAQVCVDSGLGWNLGHGEQGAPGVWGWVGVFFSPRTQPKLTDLARLGVVETWPGTGENRAPSHCTDYAVGYVLRADTEEQWRRNLAEIVS